MDSKEWRKISRVITQVLTLPHDSRIEKIKELCNDDSELIDEVQSLLDSIENSDDFLDNQRNKKNALFQELEDILENPSDIEDFFTGQTLGRWTLTELLGHGGMGSVYKAERTDEDGIRQDVALKIIHKSLVTPLLSLIHI